MKNDLEATRPASFLSSYLCSSRFVVTLKVYVMPTWNAIGIGGLLVSSKSAILSELRPQTVYYNMEPISSQQRAKRAEWTRFLCGRRRVMHQRCALDRTDFAFPALIVMTFLSASALQRTPDCCAAPITIVNNGDPPNRVDVVFLGDGYTQSDLNAGAFDQHIQTYLNHMFTDSGFLADPFPRYKNFSTFTTSTLLASR